MFATFTFAQPSSANSKDAAAIDSTQLDSLPPIEKMPELVEFIKADYPPELAKKGVEGTVLLELIVNDSGRVDSAAVVQGIDPQLDSAVVAAVRKFVFSPAIAGGAPVAVMMEYAYRITLDEVVKPIEQYVNFKGKLLQRGTRSPVTGAMVIVTCLDSVSDTALSLPFGRYLQKIGNFAGQKLEGNSIITTSDEQGTFSFVSLPACSVQIKIIAPSYEAFTDKECVVRGIATDVLYRLSRVEYGDNEIVVYGKQEKKEVAKQSLTLSEVRRVPGFGGDAVKVIQALPGVARAAFGGGQIIVRGSGDGDSRYYLDGVEIPSLYHFGGLKSTYNSDALQTVDFYPGGFGTRFGGAIAGVVELKTRPIPRICGCQPVRCVTHGRRSHNKTAVVYGNLPSKLHCRGNYRRTQCTRVIASLHHGSVLLGLYRSAGLYAGQKSSSVAYDIRGTGSSRYIADCCPGQFRYR